MSAVSLRNVALERVDQLGDGREDGPSSEASVASNLATRV
jgi:hypothetical protein